MSLPYETNYRLIVSFLPKQQVFVSRLPEAAVKSLCAQPRFVRAPAAALLLCRSKADGEANNDENNDYANSNQDSMLSIVNDLANQHLQYRVSAAVSSEATFAEKYLHPVLRRVLLSQRNDRFFYSLYQAEDDMTKLMKLMKNSVDQQLYLGVTDPLSLGVLVEGFECTMYRMQLIVHGVYIPVAIKRFSLVEQTHHLVLLPGMVESFYFVKLEINKFMDMVLTRKSKKEKQMNRVRVEASFVTKFEPKRSRK
ncbi:hypothetical protein [Parasitella parasitica]|uniref:Uncharacterized protein n=1 Tax=Parasitella parasitica TaxID=35722 RepID=A0A0B7NI46_9FUNG|nr:hypothetical protein [Parasitella parasitica]